MHWRSHRKNMAAVHWHEAVKILWDATTDAMAIELTENQSGTHDYSSFGGLTNNAGAGKTGDIKLTTVGHTSADTYTIILYMRKEYA